MDYGLLVEIFVPVIHGDEGQIATGYPVARDLILTARHVLFPKNRDRNKPIELRWHYKGTAWTPISEDDAIVWDGGENLDAALIKFCLPEVVGQFDLLSAEIPRPTAPWWSKGFAEVGKRAGNERPPVGLTGEFIDPGGTSCTCEIGVKYIAEGEGAEQWQGASGCPIFSGTLIVGIAKSSSTKFKGNRLSITLSNALLNDAEFRKTVNFDAQDRRFKKAVKRVKNILDQSDPAAEVIREELLQDYPQIPSGNGSLAESLLQTTFDDLLQFLSRATAELLEENNSEAVVVLKKLSRLVTPLVFDSCVIDSIRRSRNEPACALIDTPVTTSTLAELIMAGVDGRSVRFKGLPQGHRWPTGDNCLEKLPEGGIHHHETLFVQRFHDVIIDEFLGEDEKARIPELTRNQKIRRAAQVLEVHAAEPRTQTRYVIYHATDENLLRQIAQLKDDYRALMFLSLDPDNEKFLEETKRIGKLPGLLLDEHTETK